MYRNFLLVTSLCDVFAFVHFPDCIKYSLLSLLTVHSFLKISFKKVLIRNLHDTQKQKLYLISNKSRFSKKIYYIN